MCKEMNHLPRRKDEDLVAAIVAAEKRGDLRILERSDSDVHCLDTKNNNKVNYHLYVNDREWVKSLVRFSLGARATGILGEDELIDLLNSMPHMIRTLQRALCVDDDLMGDDIQRFMTFARANECESIRGLAMHDRIGLERTLAGPGSIVLNLSRIRTHGENAYMNPEIETHTSNMTLEANYYARRYAFLAVCSSAMADPLLLFDTDSQGAYGYNKYSENVRYRHEEYADKTTEV